ncbi:MAG TPA: glutamate formimidoyltransferase [Thermoplasmata archaeon]|nr:glutamate formimidoyltransferase [Thermoplasmata archaeon]
MTHWFEAVPNFSEGRSTPTISAIADAGRGVSGVTVLDVESNADHNRCVISLVGEGDALLEALVRMAKVAIDRIDLTHHTGEHPRMGAVDVIPFVPLGESTMEEAVALAVRLGERLWRDLSLPVYLYGTAARRPERQDLAVARKGGFEGIRDSIATDPARLPDFGEARVHPTAGIVAVGARPVLIAFNAYLGTSDLSIAKKVAHAVRARDGGLAEVKALGFEIKERGVVQVSMNLTDFRRTPVHRALEAVRREAKRYGVSVDETEIVGLVPEDALFDAAEFYLQLNRFDRATVLERKVRAASSDRTDEPASSLAASSLTRFAELLAARTPTPGGGSAAAAAAAFGVALGEMVVSYSMTPAMPNPDLEATLARLRACRVALLAGVDRDTAAYEELRTSRRALKSTPDDRSAADRYRSSVRAAIEVPLETARASRAAAGDLVGRRPLLKTALASDLSTALALLEAATAGALANATINLPDLEKTGESTDGFRSEIERLRKPPGP